jgi:acyl dehydratase
VATTETVALVDLDELRQTFAELTLPGAELTVEAYESALADHALLAPAEATDHAHPFWLLALALRGMGISVDELCAHAQRRQQDTLLFGSCEIQQHRPVAVGATFRTTAAVDPVTRKESRGGGHLDFVTIRVEVHDTTDPSGPVGAVTQGFIFKRGA